MSLASMLTQTARIQRLTPDSGASGQDEYGNEVSTAGWTTIETVMCRVEMMFSEEDDIARTTNLLRYRVFLCPTDITENDRLLLDSLDGRVMEIIGIDEEWGRKNAHHLVVWGTAIRNQDATF